MSGHSAANPVYPTLANTTPDGLSKCSGGPCPTVFDLGDDMLAVQGYPTGDLFADGFIPQGEDVVRVPKGLIRQLIAGGHFD